jgi:DNA repair exonuclease SbcCD ATPase subunit
MLFSVLPSKGISRMTLSGSIPSGKALVVVCMAAGMAACQTAYYGAMEKLGFEKRDILVNRVEDARGAQQDAKEQFENALEQFIAVTEFEGGELESRYRKLKAEFDASEARAEKVRGRIADVERVAKDLFREWEKELGQYSSQDMRRSSERQLKDTRQRYAVLIDKMQRAERAMDPVLDAFRDRVLFLKHNLNAQAVASLRNDRAAIESDIASLIKEMNRSIAEADAFIENMSAN